MRILQVTDIHIGTPFVANHQATVLDRMVEAVATEVEECGAIDLLLLTGDLIWGADGRSELSVAEQWESARSFVTALMEASQLSSPTNLFAAPGNHDLRREAFGMMQGRFLRSANAKDFENARNDPGTWAALTSAFDLFDEFLTDMSMPGAGEFSTTGHYGTTRDIGGVTVGLAIGNTCFGAFDSNDQNNLHFGAAQTESLVRSVRGAALQIFLTHHPLSWLRQDTERQLEPRVRSEFDIHFHGHEHRIRINDAGQLMTLEGGAAYDHDGAVENYFTVLSLDFTARDASVRAWELTAASGHRWRPCTQWGFEEGVYPNLNAGHVFGSEEGGGAASTSSATSAPGAKDQASLKELVTYLDVHYGLRWQTGDFREASTATAVFWPVRLREPTIIHAVQAFVAVGLQNCGAEVSLVIDDLGNTGIRGRNGFESKMRGWMDFVIPAQGDNLAITALSDLLAEPSAAAPGWAVVRSWWSIPNETISNVFHVSKLLNDTVDLASVVDRSPRRLMSPPMVWAGLAITYPPDSGRSIVTLCGDDERPLWDTWQKYCDDTHRLPTAHLFLPSLEEADGAPIHMAEDSLSWKDRTELHDFLQEARRRDNFTALAWLSRMCVDLPADLRGDEPPRLITDASHMADQARLDALEQALAIIVDV